MRKTIVLSVICAVLLFSACHETKKTEINGDQGLSKSEKNFLENIDPACAGLANLYFVDTKIALDMKSNFHKLYIDNPNAPEIMKKFIDSVWIDSSVIYAFSDFLEKNSNFDGLDLVNGAYDDDSSTIFIFPTISKGVGHEAQTSTSIPITQNHTFKNFNIDPRISIPSIQKFRRLYRQQSIPNDPHSARFDSLSSKVWLSACVFEILSEVIRSNSTSTIKLDGATLYFAAYLGPDRNRKTFTLEQYDHQTTIIIVPTTTDPKVNGGHIPNWTAVKPTFDKLFELKNIRPESSGVLNHGQLCPNQCN